MKNALKEIIRKAWLGIVYLFFSGISFAQDKGVDIDVTIKKDNWYQQPWVWIVGGAVLILLLAAILKGGRSQTK